MPVNELYAMVIKGVGFTIERDAEDGRRCQVLPLAQSHDDARRLRDWWNAKRASEPCTLHRIGAFAGETLDDYTRQLIDRELQSDDVLTTMLVVRAWRDDGEPIFGRLSSQRR
jgi:hypothetical protein